MIYSLEKSPKKGEIERRARREIRWNALHKLEITAGRWSVDVRPRRKSQTYHRHKQRGAARGRKQIPARQPVLNDGVIATLSNIRDGHM